MKLAVYFLGAAALIVGAVANLTVLAQDSPTIRVTTRLVQVNVIVRDKNGPVRDLKKEDFSVFEKGKQRPIASFSMTEAASGGAAPQVRMPANIFSNRFSRAAVAPRTMTVILIDGINTDVLDQKTVRNSALRVLESLTPEDNVAIYAMGVGALRVLHDFTSDFDQLSAALKQARLQHGGQIEASTPLPANTRVEALDAMFNDQNEKLAEIALTDRAQRTTDALAAIARHIAMIPGRKNLIWISGSFPLGVRTASGPAPPASPTMTRGVGPTLGRGGMPEVVPTQTFGGSKFGELFTDQMRKSWRALNEANVAVYPVDARGLLSPDLGLATGGKLSMAPPSGIDTMRLLADQTGGVAMFNTNDLVGAMRRAIDDSRVTYTIGFHAAAGDLDGKFHDLKVKVSRPGLDVRHRTGYLALDDVPRTDKQIEEDLRTVAARPLDIAELGVSARGDLIRGNAPELRISVSIDLSDVRVEKRAERCVGKIELFLFQVGENGARLDSTSAVIPLDMTEQTYQAAAREGLVITKMLKPAAGAQLVRVLVLDRGSGKIGSLAMPMGPIAAASK